MSKSEESPESRIKRYLELDPLGKTKEEISEKFDDIPDERVDEIVESLHDSGEIRYINGLYRC